MADITEKLAAGVPDRGVKISYGELITVDGTEMVPVAFVSYGFGAGNGTGSGSGSPVADEGELDMSGGGGGGVSIPVGAYIGGPDGLRFRANPIALAWVAIPLIAVSGWALAKIARALS